MNYNGNCCWLCGRNGCQDPLDTHHIFGGANRSLSGQLGATVRLCHDRCHIFGPEAVHNNRETAERLKAWGQKKVMEEQGWTRDEFRQVFGKNYLEEEWIKEERPSGSFALTIEIEMPF